MSLLRGPHRRNFCWHSLFIVVFALCGKLKKGGMDLMIFELWLHSRVNLWGGLICDWFCFNLATRLGV
jgi:hypothetical protein